MREYSYMPLREVLKYEPEMQAEGVSKVARSPRGFLTAYKKARNAGNLSDYWRIRRGRIYQETPGAISC